MRKTVCYALALSILTCFALTGALANPRTSSEDLLAAALSTADIAVLRPTEKWWPRLPEFNTGVDPDRGEVCFVCQDFTRVGRAIDRSGDREIETTLTLYDGEPSAAAALKRLALESKAQPCGVRWTNESVCCAALEGGLYRATVRFRVGPILGRVTIISDQDGSRTAVASAYGDAVARKLRLVLDGHLKAQPLPPDVARLLPSAGADAAVGPVRGTVKLAIEPWALADDLNDPIAVRNELTRGGVGWLLLRRYGLDVDPDEVVEAVLMRFDTPTLAAEFVRRTASDAVNENSGLNRGHTGPDSVMLYHRESGVYELQFAKGRCVADVCAWAPYGPTFGVCEPAVRKLAESWYTSLPSY